VHGGAGGSRWPIPRDRHTRITPAELSGLIDLVYEAALDGTVWTTFLAALTRATGSEVSSLLVFDERLSAGHALWTFGFPEDAMAEYPAWAPLNPHAKAAAPLMQDGVLFRNAPIARREFVESGFYVDFVRRYGNIVDAMGICLRREGERVVYLSSNRAASKRDFDAREWEIYEALRPHLQRATGIQTQLGSLSLWRAAGEDALERLDAAVFFLGENGRLLLHNQRGRRHLDAGDGLKLTRDGRLSATTERDAARLRRAVGEAGRTGTGRGHDAGDTFSLARAAGGPYGVVVSPLRRPSVPGVSGVPAVVVVVTDADADVDVATVFARLYGLTAAEACLAGLLASGRSVQEAADELGITCNTVRWTLKRVFAKTGTTRQAELVRLLLTGPARFLRAADAEPPARRAAAV